LAIVAAAAMLALVLYFLLDMKNAASQAYRFKVIWATTYFALLLVLLSHFAASIAVLRYITPSLSKAWTLAYLFAAGVGSLVVAFVSFSGSQGDTLFAKLGSVAQLVQILVSIANGLAFAASVASLATVHCLLEGIRAVSIEQFATRAKAYLLSLHSAAVVLVAALLEIYALFHWCDPGSSVLKPGEISDADSIAIAAGILFTAVLTLIYGPAAIVHHIRLDELVRTEAAGQDNFDPGKWLATHGLKNSPLLVASAMLLPLASGLIATILKKSA
jgi:hypothetical protein